MKTIKKLIITTILLHSFNPAISICALYSNNKKNNTIKATQAIIIRLAPAQIAEKNRIKEFVAKKAPYLAPFLPNVLVSLVLNYVKPSYEEIIKANNTLLYAPIQANFNSQVLINALHEGAHIEAKTTEGKTSLRYAIDSKNVDAVKTLIANCAQIDTLDSHGNPPLYYAIRGYATHYPFTTTCYRKYAQIMKVLILADANPHHPIITTYLNNTFWMEKKIPNTIKQCIQKIVRKKQKQAYLLSRLLRETNLLQQFLPKLCIINIIDDYAKPAF